MCRNPRRRFTNQAAQFRLALLLSEADVLPQCIPARGIMDSGFWVHAANIVVAFSAVGYGIDFYIGRNNQQRVRDWLETWWIKLSYVRWGNFGREEATLAVQVMDQLFGRRFFSLRRLYAVLIAAGLSIVIAAVFSYSSLIRSLHSIISSRFILTILVSLLLLSISISITRRISASIAFILRNRPAFNFIGFVALALLQYVILCVWPFIFAYATAFTILFYPKVTFEVWSYEWQIWAGEVKMFLTAIVTTNPIAYLSAYLSQIYTKDFDPELGRSLFEARIVISLALLPNMGRLLLALIFACSFLLRPIQRPISTLWARIVESDKPVFTLLFGGAAFLAETIQKIAENLS